MKEIIVVFKRTEYSTLYIRSVDGERVDSSSFLVRYMSANLFWSTNIHHQVCKVQWIHR